MWEQDKGWAAGEELGTASWWLLPEPQPRASQQSRQLSLQLLQKGR